MREGEFMLHICKEDSYVWSAFGVQMLLSFVERNKETLYPMFEICLGCSLMLQMPIEKLWGGAFWCSESVFEKKEYCSFYPTQTI